MSVDKSEEIWISEKRNMQDFGDNDYKGRILFLPVQFKCLFQSARVNSLKSHRRLSNYGFPRQRPRQWMLLKWLLGQGTLLKWSQDSSRRQLITRTYVKSWQGLIPWKHPRKNSDKETLKRFSLVRMITEVYSSTPYSLDSFINISGVIKAFRWLTCRPRDEWFSGDYNLIRLSF